MPTINRIYWSVCQWDEFIFKPCLPKKCYSNGWIWNGWKKIHFSYLHVCEADIDRLPTQSECECLSTDSVAVSNPMHVRISIESCRPLCPRLHNILPAPGAGAVLGAANPFAMLIPLCVCVRLAFLSSTQSQKTSAGKVNIEKNQLVKWRQTAKPLASTAGE